MSKIYVCDDDPVILMMVKRILGRAHQVVTCQTVDGLMENIAAEEPNVILLDYLMPEGDGLYVIELLKEKGYIPGIPIAIVTGDRDINLETSCHSAGVDDFIQKPFVPDELISRVQQILDRNKH